MEDKTPAIVAGFILIVLFYLSNSGKLKPIRDIITRGPNGATNAPSPGQAGGGTSSQPPSGATPPLHGPIGPHEPQAAVSQINALFRAWSTAS